MTHIYYSFIFNRERTLHFIFSFIARPNAPTLSIEHDKIESAPQCILLHFNQYARNNENN